MAGSRPETRALHVGADAPVADELAALPAISVPTLYPGKPPFHV